MNAQRQEGPDRRAQILEAALRVFAERGFRGATIKEIAREAEIRSPALIYWYFEDKEDLFRAVTREFLPFVRRAAEPAELMDRPPEEVLPLIARSYLDSFDDPAVVRILRIALSEAALNPEASERILGSAQRMVFGFVVAYLQRQIKLGRLKNHDPQSSARSFFGSLMGYVLTREVFAHLKEGLPEKERYVEDVTGIFMDGLRA